MKIATNRRPTPTYVMARRYQQAALPSRRTRDTRGRGARRGARPRRPAPSSRAGRDLHRAAGVRAGHDPDPRVADRLGLLPHQLPRTSPARARCRGRRRRSIGRRSRSRRSRVPGICRSTSRGCRLMPCARSAWHASWYATRVLGERGRRRLDQAEVGQERHQVVDGERRALDELAVVLHVRAASGGVHDHVIDAGERARVATREPAGRVEASVVRRERSAAALLTGNDHAPAVAGEHADRRRG